MSIYVDNSLYGANKVVDRIPCPKCRAGGGDKTGDNKWVYGDGHTHCYACGQHEHAPILRQIEKFIRGEALVIAPKDLNFPEDYMPLAGALWAKEGYAWIKGYGITYDEIVKHKIGWSAKRNMLIFPVFNESGHLLMWQGRNFGEGTKYVTMGPKADVMHIVGNPAHGPFVIVVEDFISAVKVGRCFHAMPLWGSTMTLGTLKKLSERYGEVGMWLDDNKTRDAVQLALRGSQYCPTFVISTPSDPKVYSDMMIRAHVADARKELVLPNPEPKDNPAEPLRKHYADGRVEEIDAQTGEVLKVVQTAPDSTFRWPFADRALPKEELQDIVRAPEGSIIFGWESQLHANDIDHDYTNRKSEYGS